MQSHMDEKRTNHGCGTTNGAAWFTSVVCRHYVKLDYAQYAASCHADCDGYKLLHDLRSHRSAGLRTSWRFPGGNPFSPEDVALSVPQMRRIWPIAAQVLRKSQSPTPKCCLRSTVIRHYRFIVSKSFSGKIRALLRRSA